MIKRQAPLLSSHRWIDVSPVVNLIFLQELHKFHIQRMQNDVVNFVRLLTVVVNRDCFDLVVLLSITKKMALLFHIVLVLVALIIDDFAVSLLLQRFLSSD